MGRRLWTAAAGMFAIATFITACGGGEPEPAETPPAAAPAPPPAGTADTGAATGGQLPEGVTQEMVAAGQQIFTGAGGCQACHGPDASGTPLAPNLRDNEWLNISGRNYEEIVNIIKSGVDPARQHPAPMPPRGGSNITDEQVNQVAAYIMSLGG